MAVSATPLDVARTAWRGVDVLSMNCTRTVGQVLAEDVYVLEFWLTSSQKKAEPKADDVWRCIVPILDLAKDYFDVHEEFGPRTLQHRSP